jgi:hypothetical protein
VYHSLTKSLNNLISVKENLVDLAVADQNDTILSDIWFLKPDFSGMVSHDKILYIRKKMKEHMSDCYILTALDEIAYLLNSIFPFDSLI